VSSDAGSDDGIAHFVRPVPLDNHPNMNGILRIHGGTRRRACSPRVQTTTVTRK
jgi:hypothetical protein